MEIDKSKDESRQGLVGDQAPDIRNLVRDKVKAAIFRTNEWNEIFDFNPNHPKLDDWAKAELDRQADAAISAIYEVLEAIELPSDMRAELTNIRDGDGKQVHESATIHSQPLTKIFREIIKSLRSLHQKEAK